MNNNSIILNKNKKAKIKHCICIADVHINNDNYRDKEYYQRFDNMFEELDGLDLKVNETVIFLLGDIMNSSKILSTSAIVLAKYLISNLSKYGTICYIVGNHECCIDDPLIPDTLTSIIKELKTENDIYHLNENKMYFYK